MQILTALYLAAAVSLPAHAVHQRQPAVPTALQEPLAAIVRIATGLQAERVCNRLSANAQADMTTQLKLAVQTLHTRMVNAKIPASKSQRILTRLMNEGEKLAKSNYPTCTNSAPDIIVKATQDAACINQYLANTNKMCFHKQENLK